MTQASEGKDPLPGARRHLSPPRTIALSFGVLILVGTVLLTLPIASANGESIGFLDALFTATSASCVTGLVVVNTMAHWSWFGKAVILLLIQVGGLGTMTVLTITMITLRRRISLRGRLVIQASFNQDSVGGMVRLVKRIVYLTLLCELAGAILLSFIFFATMDVSPIGSLVLGLFHSISAFCNAGFDILGPESLVPYVSNTPLNLIIAALVILGGLGFPVLAELLDLLCNIKKRSLRLRINHLSLHTKIVLVMTAALLLGGTALFLLFEWRNATTLGTLSPPDKLLAAFFQSVTLRTAGYNSIPQDGLTDISQFFSSLFMLVGGSPAGTAGGLKTVTLGVILFAMHSAVRGRDNVEAFGRTLPLDLLQKSLTVASTVLCVTLLSTLILHFSERNTPFPHTFLDLFFESSSAVGTVGVTTGITPHLSAVGKLNLIACMFLGRLGPITVAVALSLKSHNKDYTTYPSERVIIG